MSYPKNILLNLAYKNAASFPHLCNDTEGSLLSSLNGKQANPEPLTLNPKPFNFDPISMRLGKALNGKGE